MKQKKHKQKTVDLASMGIDMDKLANSILEEKIINMIRNQIRSRLV